MNVDNLQKINALASELKKHQFVTSNEDAYKHAEDMYEHGKPLPESPEDTIPQSTNPDALTERKMQLLLDMNNKKYEEELSILRNGMERLYKELTELREQIKKQNTPPPKAQQELKTEPKTSHPKRGEYSSSDVDIQKMFYFGTKR